MICEIHFYKPSTDEEDTIRINAPKEVVAMDWPHLCRWAREHIADVVDCSFKVTKVYYVPTGHFYPEET